MDWGKYVADCEDRLQSAIAPLTAPDPHEARKIERAIAQLIDAKISMALENAGVQPTTRQFTSRSF